MVFMLGALFEIVTVNLKPTPKFLSTLSFNNVSWSCLSFYGSITFEPLNEMAVNNRLLFNHIPSFPIHVAIKKKKILSTFRYQVQECLHLICHSKQPVSAFHRSILKCPSVMRWTDLKHVKQWESASSAWGSVTMQNKAALYTSLKWV